MTDQELDVRPLRKPDKHPTIFRTYEALAVGQSFVLVNNHDPRPLRAEFDLDHPGSYDWHYLETGPTAWRIRISKLASTPLPRILGNTATTATTDPTATGAVWKLQMSQRDLDSNIIQLSPDGTIESHAGPDLDVLLIVLGGTGQLTTELNTLDLHPGGLVWLPGRSQRQFTAGGDGLRYLTVHHHREPLPLNPVPPAATPDPG